MNREILFRGMRTDGSGWVEGQYFYDLNGGHTIVVTLHDGGDGRTEPPCDYQEYYNVIPETVGQYTGETIYNDVNVFEGDRCSYTTWQPVTGGDTQRVGAVVFEFGSWMITDESNPDFMMFLNEAIINDDEFKVIGNIHE